MRRAFGQPAARRLREPSPNSEFLVACSVAVPSSADCSDSEGFELGKEGRKKGREGGKKGGRKLHAPAKNLPRNF